MIVEKASPTLGRWLAIANHVLGNDGLGNGQAKLHQLAMHSGSTPERIRPRYVSDQLPHFWRDTRSTGPTPSALPCPIASEAGAVPPDDGLGFHDDQHAVPVRPNSCARAPRSRGRRSRPAAALPNVEGLRAVAEVPDSQGPASGAFSGPRRVSGEATKSYGMLLRCRGRIKCAARG